MDLPNTDNLLFILGFLIGFFMGQIAVYIYRRK